MYCRLSIPHNIYIVSRLKKASLPSVSVMGRIKTQMIKRLTFQLLRDHKSEVKQSFDENKVMVEQHMGVTSKKIRNTVAGYITRLSKRREES